MDQSTAQNLDPETQKRLNSPLVNPNGLSAQNQTFLNLFVEKVERNEINLMQPSTLINHAVYDALAPDKQGKVDFDAVNLLSTLRNIYGLWKTYGVATYQIENMVHQVRLMKERLEEVSGDVYVV